jgi:hypothetical protein
MHVQTQFSIFLINKPGVLAAVTGALARRKINLRALSLSDSGEHGVLRIVSEDQSAAREVLGQTHDRWTETDVLVLELDNHPGSFAHVAEALANEHINILYAYCTGGAPKGKTTAVFKVNDLKKAEKVIQAMQHHRPENGTDVKAPPTRG